MPPNRRPKSKVRPGPYDQEHNSGEWPAKPNEPFSCPFVKHNPVRYEAVTNSCTLPEGFKTIGALNEHIWRVHSLLRGCLRCKKRFTLETKEEIETRKLQHEATCKPKQWTAKDPEWLSAEQEFRFAKWKQAGSSQDDDAVKWSRIYRCIFPDDERVHDSYYDYFVHKHLIPSQCHHCVHLQSVEHSRSIDLPLEAEPPRTTGYLDTTRNHLTSEKWHDHEHSECIDPSLEAEPTKPTAKLDTSRRQLHAEALQQNEEQFDYGFDFKVYNGTDSAYCSKEENPDTAPQHPEPQPTTSEDGNVSLIGVGRTFGTDVDVGDMYNGVDFGSEDSINDELNL